MSNRPVSQFHWRYRVLSFYLFDISLVFLSYFHPSYHLVLLLSLLTIVRYTLLVLCEMSPILVSFVSFLALQFIDTGSECSINILVSYFLDGEFFPLHGTFHEGHYFAASALLVSKLKLVPVPSLWSWGSGCGDGGDVATNVFFQTIVYVKLVCLHAYFEFEKSNLVGISKSLEQRKTLQRKFIKRLSHELKTSMNGIFPFMKNLQDIFRKTFTESAEEKVKVKNSFKMIDQCLHEVKNLVNDLGDFQKLKSKEVKLYEKNCDIQNLILNIIRIQRNTRLRKKAHNVKVSVSMLSKNIPHVICDSSRVSQIVTNLVSNSFKYTDRGKVRITMMYCPKTEDFTFRITDTGYGIAPENLKKIFAPFSRIKGSKPSLGLGLVIAKELTELMNGKLRVYSKGLGQGTTAEFTIKFAPSPFRRKQSFGAFDEFDGKNNVQVRRQIVSGKKIEAGLVQKINAGFADKYPFRILYVEDNSINQKVMNFILKKTLGFKQFTVANNGLQALQILRKRQNDFDMIFMDLNMPVMGGVECVKKMRHELKSRTIVYAVTATKKEEDSEWLKTHGFQGIVEKPITTQKMRTVLIDNRHSLERNRLKKKPRFLSSGCLPKFKRHSSSMNMKRCASSRYVRRAPVRRLSLENLQTYWIFTKKSRKMLLERSIFWGSVLECLICFVLFSFGCFGCTIRTMLTCFLFHFLACSFFPTQSTSSLAISICHLFLRGRAEVLCFVAKFANFLPNMKLYFLVLGSLVLCTWGPFSTRSSSALSCLFVLAKTMVHFRSFQKQFFKEKSRLDLLLTKMEDVQKLQYFFLGKISHDMRNPICGLQVFLGELEELMVSSDKINDSEQYNSTFRIIIRCMDELERLVNNCVEYYRIENHKLTLDSTEFNVWSLVEDIMRSQMKVYLKEKYTLTLNFVGGITERFRLKQDERKVVSTIRNVCCEVFRITKSNVTVNVSYEYNTQNPPQKPSSSTSTSTSTSTGQIGKKKKKAARDGKLKLKFEFECPGVIGPISLPNSFTFLSNKRLGLMIAKGLVSFMSGEVKIKGRKKRKEIKLVIPAQYLGQSPSRKRRPSKKMFKKVLLVDDSAVALRILKNLILKLPDQNFDVIHSCRNGYLALELLKKEPIDIIISDINMPVMDGFTMIENILRRGIMHRDDFGVLLSSGDDIDIGKVLGKHEGLKFSYLQKPVSQRMLLDGIAALSKQFCCV